MPVECHVCVIDIGKPGRNLGWALSDPEGCNGTDLDACIEAVNVALHRGPLALGFEAPMFTPIRCDPMTLTKARSGEAAHGVSRPFSASAGATVLVTALVVVPYVLKRLRDRWPNKTATMDWGRPMRGRADLLLFEAFVTNQKNTKDTKHVEDALLAISAFQQGMKEPASFQSAVTAAHRLNLLGACMLRTGWSEDANVLNAECLVVRAGG